MKLIRLAVSCVGIPIFLGATSMSRAEVSDYNTHLSWHMFKGTDANNNSVCGISESNSKLSISIEIYERMKASVLQFQQNDWNFSPAVKVPFILEFEDSKIRYNTVGIGSNQYINVNLDSDGFSTLTTNLANAPRLTLVLNGANSQYSIDLVASRKALLALFDCAKKMDS
jgi:hypothetical protein